MRRLSYIRRKLRRDDGQALVELALAMPLLLILLTAIFQFGMVFNDYEALTDAARTGARSLALQYNSTDPCDAAVAQTITSASGVVALLGTQVIPTFASSTGGTTTGSYCGSVSSVACTNYQYKTSCNSAGQENPGDEATITVKDSVPISVFGFKITTIALSTQSSDAVE
jgi:Flp pilus assembly protein TadG